MTLLRPKWAAVRVIGRLLQAYESSSMGTMEGSFFRRRAMFNFGALFQNVLAGLQESFVSVIVQFISSLFGTILPGG